MVDNHPEAVKQLKMFLQKLPNHRSYRAIEVACGDGRLTRDLLSGYYQKIIMFDQCPQAIEDAKVETINEDNIELCEPCTMQDFKFEEVGEINAVYI